MLGLSVNPTPGHDKSPALDDEFHCVTCHTLPTGTGPVGSPSFNNSTSQFDFVTIAPGPLGERHTGIIPMDALTLSLQPVGGIKIPQLRSPQDKHGFNQKIADASTLGFGVLHDGRADDIDSFLGSNAFDVDNDQDVADLVAFTLCINGDDFDDLAALPDAPTFASTPELPINLATVGQLGPFGAPARTVPAATGKQVTIGSTSPPAPAQARLDLFVALAQSGRMELVARGKQDGERRSWFSADGSTFQSDLSTEPITFTSLMSLPASGSELTFMAVPPELGTRMGVDRDGDGGRDGDELLLGSDATNPNDNAFVGTSVPAEINAPVTFSSVAPAVSAVSPTPGKRAVIHLQGGDYTDTIVVDTPTIMKRMIHPLTGVPVGGVVRIGGP